MEMGFVVWAMVGVGVGWLVGQLTPRSRHGLMGNLIVGLMGALLSGYLTQLMLIDASAAWIVLSTLAASFVGAVGALSFLHWFAGRFRH